MAETIGVNLTGSASGFVSAVDAATAGMQRLEKQAAGMGAIGAFLKSTVLPAASAIAGAFAASKALSVFGDSDLPGAKKYVAAVDASKAAVTKLGAAVGEFLAPGAIRLSKIIETIANKLTPMIRVVTAFTASAGEFLMKLADNAVGAFRFMMPALDAFITSIENLFTGPARDWTAEIQQFREWWNSTWNSIITATAPMIVAGIDLISAAFTALGEMAVAAWEAVSSFIEPLLPSFESASGAAGDFAASITSGIVTAFETAAFALTNWRETAEIAWTAVKFGFQTTADAIVHYFGQIGSNISVVWDNALLGVQFFIDETKTLFGLLFGPGGYIVSLLKRVFLDFLPELAMNSVAATADRVLAFTTRGAAGNANATPVIPEFTMPRMTMGDVGARAPKYASLPGFSAAPESAEAGALRGALGSMVDSFKGGLGSFLGDKLPSIDDTATMFVDALKFMLPDVTATPGDPDYAANNPRDYSSSGKRAGLFEDGSAAAYKAILAAQDVGNNVQLEVSKAQLKEQQKTNALLGAGSAGVGFAGASIP